MGQELAPWQPQGTTLSLEQRISNAKLVIAAATSPVEASKAAKRLVGSYAHMRPGDPDTFIESVAAVLSQYPLGIVGLCADPRRGIARKAKFLSIAELVEWLDAELEHYRKTAALVPRLPAPPLPVFTPEHRLSMIQRFAELVRGLRLRKNDPIDELRRAARQGAQ